MEQYESGKAPWHLWLIGGLGLLWNAFGGYDYTMTRLRDLNYLSSMGDPKVLLAWVDSFPLVAQVAWPVGVWFSLLGSVLLLARSRHAATAFAISAVGAAVSFAYQLMNHPPAALDTPANKVVPVVIVVLIVLQAWYAQRMRTSGVLR